jgi:hypothetical protein|tara:strand:+ start:577 stop:813 length:237 start_codon:yes stop_codon:yes gene_type:complete
MPGMKRPMSRAAATKQARRMGKQAMTSDAAYSMMKKGGKAKKKSKFPDHSGDGKITKKDILMAKGIIPKTKKKTTRRK